MARQERDRLMGPVEASHKLLEVLSRERKRGWWRIFDRSSAAAALLAVFLIGGTAWAQFKAYSAGVESCGFWTKTTNDPSAGTLGSPKSSFVQWTGGYLSAYSQWVEEGSGPVSDSDMHSAVAWIDNYCQENPLEAVGTAAIALIHAIKAK